MPILGRIFNVITILLFLAFDGHLWLIYIVVNSFELLPIQTAPLNRDGFWYLLNLLTPYLLMG